MPEDRSLESLAIALRAFAAERDWDQFHSPKNLSSALVVEAAELVEVFQWMSESRSFSPDLSSRLAAREEIADVLLYLIRIADKLDVDLIEAAFEKMEKNALKYPVVKARGNSRKYTEL